MRFNKDLVGRVVSSDSEDSNKNSADDQLTLEMILKEKDDDDDNDGESRYLSTILEAESRDNGSLTSYNQGKQFKRGHKKSSDSINMRIEMLRKI